MEMIKDTYTSLLQVHTDVFFILTYYAKLIDTATVLFDTGNGNKRRLINITEFCSGMTPDYSAALLSLHTLTGCDTVSAFTGRGKKKPLKPLQNHPQFIETLAKLGEKWDMDEDFFFINFKHSSVSFMVVHSSGTLITFCSICSKKSVIVRSQSTQTPTLTPH